MSDPRTLSLADYVPVRGYGVLVTPPVMRWPSKRAAEVLDYSFDITHALEPSRDGITSALARVIPSANSADLVAGSISNTGCTIKTTLSAGVAGTRYTVILTVGTVAGRVLEFAIVIFVKSDTDP